MKASDIIAFLRDSSVKFDCYLQKDADIVGFSSLYRYREGTVAWARNAEAMANRRFESGRSYALLITSARPEAEADCVLVTEDPRQVYFQVIAHFWGSPKPVGIAPTAVIPAGAAVGQGTGIGHHTVLSPRTALGRDCVIGDSVVFRGEVIVGDGTVIQSGAVIGEEGMALLTDGGRAEIIPHYGGVKIGSRVHIGANTCICRGTIEDTVIGDDCKIDKLCHIAHNCYLHENVRIMAGTTILSSVEIGENTLVNTAVIKEQKDLGANVTVSHGAVVVKKVPDGASI